MYHSKFRGGIIFLFCIITMTCCKSLEGLPLKDLNHDQIQIKLFFDQLDMNGDSFIDHLELIMSSSKINMNIHSNYDQQRLTNIFNQIDANKDKKLDFTEFYQGYSNF